MTTSNEETELLRRADRMFDELLDLAEVERAAAMEQMTDDPELHALLQRMLDSHSGVGILDNSLHALDEVPRQIGQWRIGDELGRGGMAVVYRAKRDIGDSGQVAALKLLTVGALAGYGRERFLREQAILARLDHPYIAALLDAGVLADGTPWLAMALVEGQRIDTWCREHAPDVRAILGLFLDVCSAVAHAHGNLVVHRDLKPSNILVDTDARVRLLDFGVAGLLDDASADSLSTRSVAMTPGYAAPEQWHGEPVGVGADVYALGVILCELLSGRRPATGRDAANVSDHDKSPSKLVLDNTDLAIAQRKRKAQVLYGDLDAIVLKALRESPEHRYAAVADLADDVRRHLQRRPVAARRGTLSYRGARFVQRHKVGIASSILITMVLAAALAQGFYQAGKTREALVESEAVRGFLSSLFENNVPGGATDSAPTTRELLDRGAARARSEFARTPHLQLRMLVTLGGIYRQLGLYPQAGELLDQAMKLARDSDSLASDVGLEALRQQALLDLDNGNLDKAASALQALLETHRARQAGSAVMVTALRELGQVESSRGKDNAAIALHREAIALLERAIPVDDKTIASVRNDLGAALMRAGKNGEAIATLQTALAETRRALGPVHEAVNTAASNLAAALRIEEHYEEAERLMREVVRTDETIYTQPHPNAAQHLNNLGTALDFQDQPLAAQPYLEQARSMYLTLFGEHHPNTAIATSNLAGLEFRLGHYRVAETLQRSVLKQFLASYGTTHYSVAVARNNLARTLAFIGDLAEARELATQSLDDKRRLRGSNDRSAASNLATLAEIALQEGHPDAAQKLLEQVLDLDGMSERGNTTSVLKYRTEMARSLCRSGEGNRALTLLADNLRNPTLSASRAPLRRADTLSVSGDCLEALGATQKADNAWREALELRKNRLPDDYPDSVRIAGRMQ